MSRSSLATQSGHSEKVHSLYASDARLPAGIDFHVLFDTMRASGVWHSLLEFSHISQPSLLEAMKHRDEISLPTTLPTPISSAVDIAEEVKRRILPDLLQAASQTRANDLACLLNSLGLNLASPPSQALTQPVTHMMHPSRLRDLRTFLGDISAGFKDPQQSLALELIRGEEPSLLIIRPTGKELVPFFFICSYSTPGSGKTLPIFMSIGLYDGGATTVMILPLVAMHEEYKCRAKRYGLACQTWTIDCASDIATAPQLLLVGVENCSCPALQRSCRHSYPLRTAGTDCC